MYDFVGRRKAEPQTTGATVMDGEPHGTSHGNHSFTTQFTLSKPQNKPGMKTPNKVYRREG